MTGLCRRDTPALLRTRNGTCTLVLAYALVVAATACGSVATAPGKTTSTPDAGGTPDAASGSEAGAVEAGPPGPGAATWDSPGATWDTALWN